LERRVKEISQLQLKASYGSFLVPNLVKGAHMGWLRLVGSSKSSVSLLQNTVFFIGLFCKKRPIMLRSLLIVATPWSKRRFLRFLAHSQRAHRRIGDSCSTYSKRFLAQVKECIEISRACAQRAHEDFSRIVKECIGDSWSA